MLRLITCGDNGLAKLHVKVIKNVEISVPSALSRI